MKIQIDFKIFELLANFHLVIHRLPALQFPPFIMQISRASFCNFNEFRKIKIQENSDLQIIEGEVLKIENITSPKKKK